MNKSVQYIRIRMKTLSVSYLQDKVDEKGSYKDVGRMTNGDATTEIVP